MKRCLCAVVTHRVREQSTAIFSVQTERRGKSSESSDGWEDINELNNSAGLDALPRREPRDVNLERHADDEIEV